MAIVVQRAVPGRASAPAVSPAPGPRPQKAGLRPISFLLFNNGSLVSGPLTLNIRPEELTSEEVSRVTVQQTLGGAWADSFGRGLRQINVNGHTGWRGGPTGDGFAFYEQLRAIVYTNWHRLRADNLDAGTPPNAVELIFSDRLDDIVARVVPLRFQLRRHRSRPLLYQYQINMIDLGPVTTPMGSGEDPILAMIADEDSRYLAARDALTSTANDQRLLGPELSKVLGKSGPGRFMARSADALDGLLDATKAAGAALDEATAPAVRLAEEIERAGRNAFLVITSDSGVLARGRAVLQRGYSLLNGALCNLDNGFSQVLRLLDVESLFGASNCSSTAGGRGPSIFADLNPFADAFSSANTSAPFRLNAPAAASVSALQQDPVLQPLSFDEVVAHLGAIADGLT